MGFFEELDRREREARTQRILANRPDNLHDYQGCAKESRQVEESEESWQAAEAMHRPKSGPLTFDAFQETNALRCQTKFTTCADWSLNDWAVALVGEAGEMCNLLKKVRRGDFPLEKVRDEIVKELADIITYADLMMTELDAKTSFELIGKFNEVSQRVGFNPTKADL